MQGTRLIKYGSVSGTSNSTGSLYSSASTWGELKKEDSNVGILSSGMGAIVKLSSGNNIKLVSDSDALPEGEFTIYFVTEKNNSGYGVAR